jgi:hypothetical protein
MDAPNEMRGRVGLLWGIIVHRQAVESLRGSRLWSGCWQRTLFRASIFQDGAGWGGSKE